MVEYSFSLWCYSTVTLHSFIPSGGDSGEWQWQDFLCCQLNLSLMCWVCRYFSYTQINTNTWANQPIRERQRERDWHIQMACTVTVQVVKVSFQTTKTHIIGQYHTWIQGSIVQISLQSRWLICLSLTPTNVDPSFEQQLAVIAWIKMLIFLACNEIHSGNRRLNKT